jgi:branched-chain amino acid transport system permease protein
MSEQSMKQVYGATAGAGGIAWGSYLLWIVGALVILLAPLFFTSGTAVSILSQMGIAIVFALSYNMLLGQGGMLSFGHAVYYGLGGFITAHTLNAVYDHGWVIPVELMPLIGGLGGLLFAIPLGWISTKRGGVSFAMITLGVGELVAASSLMFTDFFGGEGGVATNRVTDITILPFDYGPSIQVYYLIAAWMLLCVLLMYLLTRTPLGRMANAVRDNPERAQFVGYSPWMVSFIQFSLAGFFAGVAGGLFAINYEILTAENLAAPASGIVLVMTFIGGIGFFFGPIIGAIVMTYLGTVLSTVTGAWLLYLGILFVMMVMFAPFGFAGLIMIHKPLWQAGLLRRMMPVYALVAGPALLLFFGIVALIEMAYHLSTSYDPSVPMELFFWDNVVVTNAMPWIIVVVVTLVGAVATRWTGRKVKARWDSLHEMMMAGGQR